MSIVISSNNWLKDLIDLHDFPMFPIGHKVYWGLRAQFHGRVVAMTRCTGPEFEVFGFSKDKNSLSFVSHQSPELRWIYQVKLSEKSVAHEQIETAWVDEYHVISEKQGDYYRHYYEKTENQLLPQQKGRTLLSIEEILSLSPKVAKVPALLEYGASVFWELSSSLNYRMIRCNGTVVGHHFFGTKEEMREYALTYCQLYYDTRDDKADIYYLVQSNNGARQEQENLIGLGEKVWIPARALSRNDVLSETPDWINREDQEHLDWAFGELKSNADPVDVPPRFATGDQVVFPSWLPLYYQYGGDYQLTTADYEDNEDENSEDENSIDYDGEVVATVTDYLYLDATIQSYLALRYQQAISEDYICWEFLAELVYENQQIGWIYRVWDNSSAEYIWVPETELIGGKTIEPNTEFQLPLHDVFVDELRKENTLGDLTCPLPFSYMLLLHKEDRR